MSVKKKGLDRLPGALQSLWESQSLTRVPDLETADIALMLDGDRFRAFGWGGITWNEMSEHDANYYHALHNNMTCKEQPQPSKKEEGLKILPGKLQSLWEEEFSVRVNDPDDANIALVSEHGLFHAFRWGKGSWRAMDGGNSAYYRSLHMKTLEPSKKQEALDALPGMILAGWKEGERVHAIHASYVLMTVADVHFVWQWSHVNNEWMRMSSLDAVYTEQYKADELARKARELDALPGTLISAWCDDELLHDDTDRANVVLMRQGYGYRAWRWAETSWCELGGIATSRYRKLHREAHDARCKQWVDKSKALEALGVTAGDVVFWANNAQCDMETAKALTYTQDGTIRSCIWADTCWLQTEPGQLEKLQQVEEQAPREEQVKNMRERALEKLDFHADDAMFWAWNEPCPPAHAHVVTVRRGSSIEAYRWSGESWDNVEIPGHVTFHENREKELAIAKLELSDNEDIRYWCDTEPCDMANATMLTVRNATHVHTYAWANGRWNHVFVANRGSENGHAKMHIQLKLKEQTEFLTEGATHVLREDQYLAVEEDTGTISTYTLVAGEWMSSRNLPLQLRLIADKLGRDVNGNKINGVEYEWANGQWRLPDVHLTKSCEQRPSASHYGFPANNHSIHEALAIADGRPITWWGPNFDLWSDEPTHVVIGDLDGVTVYKYDCGVWETYKRDSYQTLKRRHLETHLDMPAGDENSPLMVEEIPHKFIDGQWRPERVGFDKNGYVSDATAFTLPRNAMVDEAVEIAGDLPMTIWDGSSDGRRWDGTAFIHEPFLLVGEGLYLSSYRYMEGQWHETDTIGEGTHRAHATITTGLEWSRHDQVFGENFVRFDYDADRYTQQYLHVKDHSIVTESCDGATVIPKNVQTEILLSGKQTTFYDHDYNLVLDGKNITYCVDDEGPKFRGEGQWVKLAPTSAARRTLNNKHAIETKTNNMMNQADEVASGAHKTFWTQCGEKRLTSGDPVDGIVHMLVGDGLDTKGYAWHQGKWEPSLAIELSAIREHIAESTGVKFEGYYWGDTRMRFDDSKDQFEPRVLRYNPETHIFDLSGKAGCIEVECSRRYLEAKELADDRPVTFYEAVAIPSSDLYTTKYEYRKPTSDFDPSFMVVGDVAYAWEGQWVKANGGQGMKDKHAELTDVATIWKRAVTINGLANEIREAHGNKNSEEALGGVTYFYGDTIVNALRDADCVVWGNANAVTEQTKDAEGRWKYTRSATKQLRHIERHHNNHEGWAWTGSAWKLHPDVANALETADGAPITYFTAATVVDVDSWICMGDRYFVTDDRAYRISNKGALHVIAGGHANCLVEAHNNELRRAELVELIEDEQATYYDREGNVLSIDDLHECVECIYGEAGHVRRLSWAEGWLRDGYRWQEREATQGQALDHLQARGVDTTSLYWDNEARQWMSKSWVTVNGERYQRTPEIDTALQIANGATIVFGYDETGEIESFTAEHAGDVVRHRLVDGQWCEATITWEAIRTHREQAQNGKCWEPSWGKAWTYESQGVVKCVIRSVVGEVTANDSISKYCIGKHKFGDQYDADKAYQTFEGYTYAYRRDTWTPIGLAIEKGTAIHTEAERTLSVGDVDGAEKFLAQHEELSHPEGTMEKQETKEIAIPTQLAQMVGAGVQRGLMSVAMARAEQTILRLLCVDTARNRFLSYVSRKASEDIKMTKTCVKLFVRVGIPALVFTGGKYWKSKEAERWALELGKEGIAESLSELIRRLSASKESGFESPISREASDEIVSEILEKVKVKVPA